MPVAIDVALLVVAACAPRNNGATDAATAGLRTGDGRVEILSGLAAGEQASVSAADSKRYLAVWARLMATPGRARQSLEQSSFDAWIKLYKPDESNANTTVSYYLKGGLVMFGLYAAGVAGALLAALALRGTILKGSGGGFMMELPKYQWPRIGDVLIGLLQRIQIFLKRAGTIILATTIVLWALASVPEAGPGEKQSEVSIAGRIADGIEVVVRPIGFNHEIAMALLPAMAAREVAVKAGVPVMPGDLVMADEVGRGVSRLTQGQGSNSYPACSPDGRLVAFYGAMPRPVRFLGVGEIEDQEHAHHHRGRYEIHPLFHL